MYSQLLQAQLLFKFKLILIKKVKGDKLEENWASLKAKVEQFITKVFEEY